MDNKIVITIARQYGSGGRTIASMLSEKLNIPFYDKDLIKRASEESGVNEALFANADETSKGLGLLNKLIKKSKIETTTPNDKEYTSPENLFALQADIIKKLADTESCIIVGRCADYILKDYDNVLSVFIHAPFEFCLEKAAEKKSLPSKELETFVKNTNKQREAYYKYFTDHDWADARNYDLCLDSSKLGYDRCVEEIIAYMNIRFPKEG